ncbi:SDH family Clp fold serine proteinase [Clostridium ganghwense]|uniref:Serine dehydrogenase proteinase n=1 Tax=Clostridium ganghwense TaxID=312089 RepID=A0ABT4CRY7_9CLOT|nr:hypothetical protein [Clostridium ganghwense]MCY6371825.1 hypothetical protein [Clostridium ganghwense]
MNNYRTDLINHISQLRGSNVISYIGGDRQNMSIRIAPDIIPVFYKHLEKMGKSSKIDLFLFTKGGDVLTALRLVELLYEYTDDFSVLIPYKSYSAGTLISLGASEIVMTKLAELSPIDPNVTSTFNPLDSNNPNVRLPISVEDVYSFFNIATDEMGLKTDDSLVKVFSLLSEHVHPLAIGSVYRSHAMIRSIANKLLLKHINPSEKYKINEIIENLTENLHSHSYMISRQEAKNLIKLPITYCDNDLEKYMWNLYKTYENDLLLDRPFAPEQILTPNGKFSVCCGIIESNYYTDGYIFEGNIPKIPNVKNSLDSINITEQGWRQLR